MGHVKRLSARKEDGVEWRLFLRFVRDYLEVS